MKYQFKIANFIQDKDVLSIPDNLLIATLKSDWLYHLQDKIYEFDKNDVVVLDRELGIIVWKEWCIPYKE